MVDILGAIVRGLSNSKSSEGTNPQVPTQQNNPLVYGWIGLETNDQRQPIQKEQTQNPTLGLNLSSGTQYEYTTPVPTDIQMRTRSNYPDANVARTEFASPNGSLIQPIPNVVPVSNAPSTGDYIMSPINASHFARYFANQMGNYNLQGKPNPANVLTAIGEQANVSSDGSANVWHGAWQTILAMRKPYDPNGANHWQGLRQS